MKTTTRLLTLLSTTALIASAYGPDSPRWRTVNDTVMGGVSSSSATMIKDGLVRFSGILSLDNNGGFTSIRADSEDFAFPSDGTLVLKVKGDGRSYTVDLRTQRRQGAFSYKSGFQTKAGEEMEVRLPLSSFRATAFGRMMPVATPLDPSRVISFGFMLAEKNPGPFRLDILSAEFEPAEVTAVTTPEGLIHRSISLGVPLFNRGDADACAAVYETTANALLLLPKDSFPVNVRDRLAKDLHEMDPALSATDRAWALRRSLDRVLQAMM